MTAQTVNPGDRRKTNANYTREYMVVSFYNADLLIKTIA